MPSTVRASRASSGRRRCARSASADQLRLDRIPAPRVLRRDVGAADPAIDTEELDLVGFAVQRALAQHRQPQLKLREPSAVAERGRRRKRLAVVGFDEPPLSLPERRESPVEPRVADKRCLLEPLRRDEGSRGRARAGGDRLEYMPFRPRKPVGRRRQLLEQPAERDGEKRKLSALTPRNLREHRRLRGPEGGPGFYRQLELSRARRPPRRPERLELAGAELAEAGKGRLPRERTDDDQLRRHLCRV